MYSHCKHFSKGYLNLFFFSFLLHNHRIINISSISGPPVFYKYFTSVTIKLFCKSKWFFRMTVSKGNDSKSSLVTYFIHRHIYVYIYMSIPISPFILPYSYSPWISTSLFSMSVYLFLCCKWHHLYHFSRFHTDMLISDICFSDLLHFLWQSPGPSTSLKMT